MTDRQELLLHADDYDDENLGFGGEDGQSKTKLKHPIVAFFHVFFRGAALLIYIFCGFSQSGFIPSFVLISLLLSLDFWTVKNITGRILVGLRWWNYVDDDGISHWVFESRKGNRAGGRPPEKRVFWTALVATPVIWFLLFFYAIVTLSLRWTILVLLALGLNLANLYGYIRCKLGHKPGIQDATGIFGQSFSSFILRQVTGEANRPATTANSTQQV